ncbi:MAG: ferritin family protein [Deltaproteobacteria bacterium]|nr:ferritin family protein [Deltaproteobacteria bacterium]
MQFKSVDEILDFAIGKEQEAQDLYNSLANQAANSAMKSVFKEFAAEEGMHKKKLEAVKSGKKLASSEKKILDLKIGDYLVDVEVKPDLSYQEALILAMKAEKNAYKMYHNLAQAADDPGIKQLLLELAQEEAKHKLRFEIEYDDNILLEN